MSRLAIDGEFDEMRFARTASELADEIARGLELGGQIFVARHGEVLADAAFGEARPGEPMRRDRLMLWMSSTKPVAAVAICQLWERGRLELDDPVARHIPEFAQGGKERVTVRHLLTHTGGVRMLDTGWPTAGWEGIVARVCAQRLEPRWEPGRKAGYHLASSWFILGELVRRLDGRRFEIYVREEIFGPLAANDCWIGMPEERFRLYGGRIAPMFDVTPAAGETAALVENGATAAARLVVPSPGGNGCGPIRELARLYQMLSAGGAFAGRRLLRRETVEALTARHRVGMVDATFRARLDWGLGVIVNSAHYGEPAMPYGYGPFAGPRTYGHSGARSSTAFADPEAGLVVALAVNGMPADEAHRERFERLAVALYGDLGLALLAPRADAI
ncbi:MAG: serine hydrolase domain-containing protein [Thermoanaerobaculia bacterium]